MMSVPYNLVLCGIQETNRISINVLCQHIVNKQTKFTNTSALSEVNCLTFNATVNQEYYVAGKSARRFVSDRHIIKFNPKFWTNFQIIVCQLTFSYFMGQENQIRR